MARLQCQISEEHNAVVTDARIVHRSKERALHALIMLALLDPKFFKGPFFPRGTINCTLPMTEAEYDATVDYRLRYKLISQTDFFSFALQHGASLFAAQQAGQVASSPA